MNVITPVQYWRANKEWAPWLGKRGRVVASTLIRVAEGPFSAWAPYSLVLVEFAHGERREFMGVGHDVCEPGEKVECVLRRLDTTDAREVIPYGLKVQKYQKQSEIPATPENPASSEIPESPASSASPASSESSESTDAAASTDHLRTR